MLNQEVLHLLRRVDSCVVEDENGFFRDSDETLMSQLKELFEENSEVFGRVCARLRR